MTTERLGRGLNRLGWLELTAIGTGFGVVIALQVAQLVTLIRHEPSPGLLGWCIAIAAIPVIGGATMLVTARGWRKHGGRQVQRLGWRVLMTDQLPDDLPTRVAVLQDLEQRERTLAQAHIPAWILSVAWTALTAWQLASHPTVLKTVAWLAVWSVFLGLGTLDVINRRMRPRLRRLITELREHPLPAEVTAS